MKRFITLLFLLISIMPAFAMESNDGNDNSTSNKKSISSIPETVILNCIDGAYKLTHEDARHFKLIQDYFDEQNYGILGEKNNQLDEVPYTCYVIDQLVNKNVFIEVENLFSLLEAANYFGTKTSKIKYLVRPISYMHLICPNPEKAKILHDSKFLITKKDLKQVIKNLTNKSNKLCLSSTNVPYLDSLDILALTLKKLKLTFEDSAPNCPFQNLNTIVFQNISIQDFDCEKLIKLFRTLKKITASKCHINNVTLPSRSEIELDLSHNHIENVQVPNKQKCIKGCKIDLSHNKLSQDQIDKVSNNYSYHPRITLPRSTLLATAYSNVSGICILFFANKPYEYLAGLTLCGLGSWNLAFCYALLSYTRPFSKNSLIFDNQNPTPMTWRDIFRYGL